MIIPSLYYCCDVEEYEISSLLIVSNDQGNTMKHQQFFSIITITHKL